ncbi:MAG TPA: phosphatidate cytidylyltransferase [Desulfobulbaceae bacterium]|nr:phosphatidate cytidylyltransferase [Desulfobulbaceae bacterium]
MKRLVPGLVMTALWLALLFFGPASLFWLVILSIASYGLLEFYRMTVASPAPGMPALIIVISILPVAASITARPEVILGALFLSLFLLILLVLARSSRIDNPLHFFGSGCLGTLYISFSLAHLVLIRSLPQGEGWLLVLTAITAGGDTGAFYIGSTLGRHKLCPQISPKKTVEGAIGGICAGMLCAVATAWYFLPQVSPYLIGLAALLLTVVSIVGDLTESVIKRSVGVKDSGRLLFGHGGVLDRIDSLLIAGPVLYYLLLLPGFLR